MVTPRDFTHRLKSQNNILKKQYHIKVLLNKFYLNRHITDKTIKLKPYNNCFVRKEFWNFIGLELYRSILSRPTTTDFHISTSKIHTEVCNPVDKFKNSVEDLFLRFSLHCLLVMTNSETSNLSTVEIINQNQIQLYQLACVTIVEALVSDHLGNSKKRSHTGMSHDEPSKATAW